MDSVLVAKSMKIHRPAKMILMKKGWDRMGRLVQKIFHPQSRDRSDESKVFALGIITILAER